MRGIHMGSILILGVWLVLCASGTSGCIVRSHEGWLEWSRASSGIASQAGITDISWVSENPGLLWLAVYHPGGAYFSTDGGENWHNMNAGMEQLVPLSILALSDGTVLAGSYQGLYRFSGEIWEAMNGLPSAPLYTLVEDRGQNRILAGLEGKGSYLSYDGGISWEAIGPPLVTTLALAVNAEGDRLYIGTAEQGLLVTSNQKTEAAQVPLPNDARHVPAVVIGPDETLLVVADGRLLVREPSSLEWSDRTPPAQFVLSVRADPFDEAIWYAGASGLWVSRDRGETWQRDDGPLHKAGVVLLDANSESAGLVYLGTQRNGLFISDDSGENWTPANDGVGTRPIPVLAGDPHQGNRLYAGGVDGVYRWVDRLERWDLVSASVGYIYVQGLAVDPHIPGRVYAGAHDGIYVSEDGGGSWRHVTEGMGAISVFPIVPHPSMEGLVLAGSWGTNVLCSRDAGETWASLHGGLETQSVYSLAVDPSNPSIIYVGTVEAIYRSLDGGESWELLDGYPPSITTFALAIDPWDSRRLYAGATDGIYHSLDGGETWSPVSRTMGRFTVNALRMDPADPRVIYAGTDDRGVLVSHDGGQSWDIAGLQDSSVFDIYLDAASRILWAGTDDGVMMISLPRRP